MRSDSKTAMDEMIRAIERLSIDNLSEEEAKEQDEEIMYFTNLYKTDARGLATAFVALKNCYKKKL
jgi:hypothetical protein